MKRTVPLVIIVVATVLAFANIFGNEFVWDDRFFILDWEKVRSWQNLPDLLRGQLPSGFSGAYRPLLGVFYLVFYQLFGTNPWGWHAQAVLVHLLNTVLVYLIVLELGRLGGLGRLGTYLPLLTALLFGLHPIHTEAVTYIAASMNTIGVLFFFLSFYLYLKSEGRKAKGEKLLSLLFALLAFFTYEFTLTLPLLLVLYEVCFRKLRTPLSGVRVLRKPVGQKHQTVRHSDSLTFRRSEFFRVFRNVLPYFAGAFLYLFIRVFVMRIGGRGEYLLGSFFFTMATMSKAMVIYLWLLLLPLSQSIVHTLPSGIVTSVYIDRNQQAIAEQSIFDPSILLSVAILAMLAILAIWSFRKHPLITFCLGWFFISLLPASNLIPVQEVMAERYLYIPSLGFVLLLAAIAQGVGRKAKGALRFTPWLFALSFTLLASFYGYLTFQRNKVWHSNVTLWTDTVKKSPTSSLVQYNLGKALADEGDLDRAMEHYKKAILLNPTYTKPYNNLGAILSRIARHDLAQKYFEQAVAIDPTFYQVHYNLGNAYMFQKKVNEAIASYEKALAINPHYVKAHSNLGVAYYEVGEFDKARLHFQKAIEIDPNYSPARTNLEKLKSGEKLASAKDVEEEGQAVSVVAKEWIKHLSPLGFSFVYPKTWKVDVKNQETVVKDEPGSFTITFAKAEPLGDLTIERYIGRRTERLGTLTTQGLADIPSVERAFVRVWDNGGVNTMEFFLFKNTHALRVVVWPADAKKMRIFDQIVNSLKFQ